MQNEAEIPIPEQETNGSPTVEDIEASMRRAVEALGIDPEFLKVPSTDLYSVITRPRIEEQQRLLDAWREVYKEYAGKILAAYRDLLNAQREYVGDEQGVWLPRTNEDGSVKETSNTRGMNKHRYYGDHRELPLLRV